MRANHAEALMMLYKNSTKKTEDLRFLKPGQYMSALANRFVQIQDSELCLVIEHPTPSNNTPDSGRYVVLVNNEQLIVQDYNLLNL